MSRVVCREIQSTPMGEPGSRPTQAAKSQQRGNASGQQGKAGRLGNGRRQAGDHHRAVAAIEAGDEH